MHAVRATAFAILAACGGSSPRPKPPAPPSLTMPIAGLEAVKRGDSHEAVAAAFPTAEPGGDDDLWVEGVMIEARPASVGLVFEDGALRGAAVAFDDPCDQLDAIAAGLDAKLGERTSAQEGIAAWSHAGWDLALYCAYSDTDAYLRLDVRPAPEL